MHHDGSQSVYAADLVLPVPAVDLHTKGKLLLPDTTDMSHRWMYSNRMHDRLDVTNKEATHRSFRMALKKTLSYVHLVEFEHRPEKKLDCEHRSLRVSTRGADVTVLHIQWHIPQTILHVCRKTTAYHCALCYWLATFCNGPSMICYRSVSIPPIIPCNASRNFPFPPVSPFSPGSSQIMWSANLSPYFLSVG